MLLAVLWLCLALTCLLRPIIQCGEQTKCGAVCTVTCKEGYAGALVASNLYKSTHWHIVYTTVRNCVYYCVQFLDMATESTHGLVAL